MIEYSDQRYLHAKRTVDDRALNRGVLDALQAGKIRPIINQRFALADVQDAHRALEARETTGATVLLP